jgi:hypothetical protein
MVDFSTATKALSIQSQVDGKQKKQTTLGGAGW